MPEGDARIKIRLGEFDIEGGRLGIRRRTEEGEAGGEAGLNTLTKADEIRRRESIETVEKERCPLERGLAQGAGERGIKTESGRGGGHIDPEQNEPGGRREMRRDGEPLSAVGTIEPNVRRTKNIRGQGTQGLHLVSEDGGEGEGRCVIGSTEESARQKQFFIETMAAEEKGRDTSVEGDGAANEGRCRLAGLFPERNEEMAAQGSVGFKRRAAVSL